MDQEKVLALAEVLGLTATARLDLQSSRISERKEKLFAATSHLHGLRVWISGRVFALLDERGFVCSTEDPQLVWSLCLIESTQGPGTVRELLKRPVVDPASVIIVAAPRFRLVPKPVEKTTPAPKARKSSGLSDHVLANLLKEL